MTKVNISLLSLERFDSIDVPRAKDRLEAIIKEVREQKPDLLVCAHDFLGSPGDIIVLAKQLMTFKHSTTVVVDSVRPGQKKKAGMKRAKVVAKHSPFLMVVEPHKSPRVIARQLISLASHRSVKSFRALEKQLPIRDVRVKGLRVSCLCCGEINYLSRSRNRGQPFFDSRFPQVIRHFNNADIILNPTHDLMMGRPYITKDKRSFLSRQINGRSRCYISVSNWDTARRGQRRTVPELHTVYVNRKSQQLDHAGFDRYGMSMACTRITLSL